MSLRKSEGVEAEYAAACAAHAAACAAARADNGAQPSEVAKPPEDAKPAEELKPDAEPAEEEAATTAEQDKPNVSSNAGAAMLEMTQKKRASGEDAAGPGKKIKTNATVFRRIDYGEPIAFGKVSTPTTTPAGAAASSSAAQKSGEDID